VSWIPALVSAPRSSNSVRLLGVVRAGRIARCRSDALVALADELGVRKILAGRVTPEVPADPLVEALGECLGEAVGQRLRQDRRVIVVGDLELGDEPVRAVEPVPP
jgi:hypothetical protein